MGFSSRLKAHKNILTLETLKFIAEYLVDGNARQAAIRSGIPETYATRHGQWLKKHPLVVRALDQELDNQELKKLNKALSEINTQMNLCKSLLKIEDFE